MSYLPHQIVLASAKEATKLRFVLDASANTRKVGSLMKIPTRLCSNAVTGWSLLSLQAPEFHNHRRCRKSISASRAASEVRTCDQILVAEKHQPIGHCKKLTNLSVREYPSGQSHTFC